MRHFIILSSYNRPRMVRQAIRSALDQKNADISLIVTDDGSNRETIESVLGAIEGDERAILITRGHKPDQLPRVDGGNRMTERINEALRLVAGDVIHYLCDDDFYDQGRMEAFERVFSNPEVTVAYGRLVYVDLEGRPTGESRYYERVDDPFEVLDHNQVAHRASVFETIPAWPKAPTGYWASDCFFFRALASKWKFHGTPETVAYKRMHGLNMLVTKGRTSGKREEGSMNAERKNPTAQGPEGTASPR